MRFTSRARLTLGKIRRGLGIALPIAAILFAIAGSTVRSNVFAVDYGQKIVDRAREIAWPYGTSDSYFRTRATDAYVRSAERAGTPNDSDCLSFVKTVIIDSGADTDFPSGSDSKEVKLVEYMKSSDKWKQINTTSVEELKPGDVLVSAEEGVGRNHIFIYLGDGKVASANLNNWYGRIGDLADEWELGRSGTPFYYDGNQYQVFRINRASNSSQNSSSSSSSYGRSSYVKPNKSQLSGTQREDFAQTNVLFYDPSECVESGTLSGICGSNSEEKIWSILRQTFDSTHAAAIFASIANEGGFQPVKWEYGNIVNLSTCDFASGMTWEDLYAGRYDGKYGVGSFGLTSGLSTYLHYINDKAPDLIKYFKDPSNTCLATGDDLAKKIGVNDTDRLIDLEVNYFLTEWLDEGRFNKFKNITNLNEAAIYWAHNIEACAACGYDAGDAQLTIRAREAQKFYDEYKDFTCEAGTNLVAGACSELSELRTKMWTEASQEDREHFMYTVGQEQYSIAGVEGYMNQIIAKYGSDGTLHDWLNGQCSAFRGGVSCLGSHTITDEEQDWINQALAGSNNVRYAVGNATGGSSEVGAGKIVCVWDGSKCRDDVDYNAEGGMGVCSVYSPSPEFGECWGLEGAEDWARSMEEKCGTSSTTSTTSTSSTSSTSAGSSSVSSSSGDVAGNDITWIGDSYSVGAQSIIEKEFPGISFGGTVNTDQSTIQDCKNVMVGFSNPCGGSSTSNPSGISLLKKAIADGGLKSYLVFALGTNDGWNNDAMNEFNKIMSEHSDVKVILVTSRTPENDYASSNDILKKMVEENSNYVLADWAAVYKESYFEGDPEKTHPVSNGGFDEWVKVIKDALDSVADGGNGCTTYEGEYPEYMQGAEPWGNLPYGPGCTYASCACGAASIAMLATVITGQDIFPNDITEYLATKFEMPYYDEEDFGKLDTEVGKHYGFEVKVDYANDNADAETKFRQYLRDGYMLHFVGSGCYPGFQLGGKCSDGHYIGIFKMIDNNTVMQANSAWGGNQESSLDDVIKAMGGGKFTAVRGSGGGGSCGGICGTTSNTVSIGSNGLTEEQAQKIADYYNSNEVTADNFIGGQIPSDCDKMNCVSFSLWFVSAFTDAVDHGGTSALIDNGSYIADTGLPSIGWKTGNEIKPFSVFGGTGSSAWSHTGVVVGKKSDDEIITIEAAYNVDAAGNCIGHDAEVMIRPKEYFAEGVGILAYSDDHLTPDEGHVGNKSMNEVLGK